MPGQLTPEERQQEIDRIVTWLNTGDREREEAVDPVAAILSGAGLGGIVGVELQSETENIAIFDAQDAENIVRESVERANQSFNTLNGRNLSTLEREDVTALALVSLGADATVEAVSPRLQTDVLSRHGDFLSNHFDQEDQWRDLNRDAPTREWQFKIALDELKNADVISQVEHDIIANPENIVRSVRQGDRIDSLQEDAILFLSDLDKNLDTIRNRAIPETGATFRASVQNLIKDEQAADIQGKGLFPRFGLTASEEQAQIQRERILRDDNGKFKSPAAIIEGLMNADPSIDPESPQNVQFKDALTSAKSSLINEAEAFLQNTQGNIDERHFALADFIEQSLAEGGRFDELTNQFAAIKAQAEFDDRFDFSTLSGSTKAVDHLLDSMGLSSDEIAQNRLGNLGRQAFQEGGIDTDFISQLQNQLPDFISEQANAEFLGDLRRNLEAVFGPAKTGTPVLDQAREQAFANLESEIEKSFSRDPFRPIQDFLIDDILARSGSTAERDALEDDTGELIQSEPFDPVRQEIFERRQRAPAGFGNLGTEDVSILEGDEFAAERLNPFAVPTLPGLPEARIVRPQLRNIPDEDIRRDIFPFIKDASPAFAQFVLSKAGAIENRFARAERRGVREQGRIRAGEVSEITSGGGVNVVNPQTGETTRTLSGAALAGAGTGQLGGSLNRRPIDFAEFFESDQLPSLQEQFDRTAAGIADRQRIEQAERSRALRDRGTIFRRRRL